MLHNCIAKWQTLKNDNKTVNFNFSEMDVWTIRVKAARQSGVMMLRVPTVANDSKNKGYIIHGSDDGFEEGGDIAIAELKNGALTTVYKAIIIQALYTVEMSHSTLLDDIPYNTLECIGVVDHPTTLGIDCTSVIIPALLLLVFQLNLMLCDTSRHVLTNDSTSYGV